jgi:Ca-activated chloride channel family protein
MSDLPRELAGLARELADVLAADGLARPGWLGPALALAALALVCAARTRPASFAWPLGEALARARAPRVDPLRLVALTARAGALLALALVLAGPIGVTRAPPEPGLGLDLVLVVDASGSMRALDAQVAGEWRTRLDLAREVVARFAEQRAAEGDRVALVVFGESAFTQCPLTSDGALLSAALGRVEAGIAGEATALGDALVLAVKRAGGAAQQAQGALTRQRHEPGSDADEPEAGAPRRLAVLLTDGRNNAGAVSVEAATRLAVASGLRVHTVAIGSAGEQVPMAPPAGGGRRLRRERHDVDPDTLARVAAATGGRFFAARRSGDLEAVYAEIDALERGPRRLPPQLLRRERPEPLLAAAGGCLLLEIALARALRRRLP